MTAFGVARVALSEAQVRSQFDATVELECSRFEAAAA